MSRSASGTVESSDPGLDRRDGRVSGLSSGEHYPAIWFFHPRFWDDRRAGDAEGYTRSILSAAAAEGWSVYWIGPGNGRIFWEAEPESCVHRDRETGINRVALGGRWVYPWLSRVMWRGLRNGPATKRPVSLFAWLVDSGWRVPDFRMYSRVLPLVSGPVRTLGVLPAQGPVVSFTSDASDKLIRLGLARERLVRLHRLSADSGEEETDRATHAARMFCALLDIIRSGRDSSSSAVRH